MKSIVSSTLKDFWSDSVWSKVIAGIILLIYAYVMAFSDSVEYKVIATLVLLVVGIVFAIL